MSQRLLPAANACFSSNESVSLNVDDDDDDALLFTFHLPSRSFPEKLSYWQQKFRFVYSMHVLLGKVKCLTFYFLTFLFGNYLIDSLI